ncbi:hypothetical protein E8E11_001766 [Didymella keratinophila]|nr:hypothetical protein E8E11_001766 [Didymella keratinophila]
MARKNCNHPVFSSLRARLVANNIHECPSCRIRLHVCEIEEVQAALGRRNGIFESRNKAREAEERKDNSERLAYSALDLCLFEELQVEGTTRASWTLQLDKAFELWEEVKDDCCSLPGHIHLQEAVEDVESDEEDDYLQSVDYCQKQELRDDDSDEADGGWQTVTSKARPIKRPFGDTVPNQATSTICDEDNHVKVQDHDTTAWVIEVPSKIARGSYWDGRNRFGLLRDIELDEDIDPFNASEVKTASEVLDHPVVTDVSGSPPTQTALASSPLKRRRSSTSSSKSHTRKHVHVGDKVTVTCGTDAYNTASLRLGKASFQRPHFSYTAAEQARRRHNFWRHSALYRPRTWALSGHLEDVNTSHYKTTWIEYEAIMDLQRWAEEMEKVTKQAETNAKLEVCGDPGNMQIGVYALPLVQ